MSGLSRAGSESSVRHGPERFKQEILGQPPADEIYHRVWGEGLRIRRYSGGGELDSRFGVDVAVRLPDIRIKLYGQEKFLSGYYAGRATLTVEYEDDPGKKLGFWFKGIPQFYFCGYLCEDVEPLCFDPWILVDWLSMGLATEAGDLRWGKRENDDGRAKASFVYCRMKDIPEKCIIASSWGNSLPPESTDWVGLDWSKQNRRMRKVYSKKKRLTKGTQK